MHDLNGVQDNDESEDDCQKPGVKTIDNVHFVFTFSKCVTSFVTAVSPSSGINSTLITITGSGFKTVKNENIMFGGHACEIQSSTVGELTCLLNTTEEPRPWVKMSVFVEVNGNGRAIIAPDENRTIWFELVPSLTSIAPRVGSYLGGTEVFLDGQGFIDGMTVALGRSECKVTSLSYTRIECITGPSFEVEANVTTERVVEIILTNATSELNATCKEPNGCIYQYDQNQTPTIRTYSPTTVNSTSTVLTFDGKRLSEVTSNVTITIGSVDCVVQTSSLTEITCTLAGLPVGKHAITVHIAGNKGYARFAYPMNITSEANLKSMSHTEGSINGGLLLTVNGHGFDPKGQNEVWIGNKPCEIAQVTTSFIQCRTPAQDKGSFWVVVSSNGHAFPHLFTPFQTTAAATPVVSTMPNTGRSGQSITIQGFNFSSQPSNNQVAIGGTACKVTASTGNSISCILAAKPAGSYPVVVHVVGKGLATTGMNFTYQLNIDSVSPDESGYGGGRKITIVGSGFSLGSMVKICGKPCEIFKSFTVFDSKIECEVPARVQSAPREDDICDVVVANSENMLENALPSAYTYRHLLTSIIASVSPSRGGTGGGVVLKITGSGFSTTQSLNNVTIDGTMCMVISATATEIKCITGQHPRTIKTKVRVDVGSNGSAIQQEADFYYVDVWSSKYTWGGRDPPVEGRDEHYI